MENDILRVLLSEDEIRERVRRLGAELSERFRGKNPLFVGILKGSFVFLADLLRCTDIESTVDFIALSSYGGGSESSGVVKVIKDLREDISDRHIVVVEDILDSGTTMHYLRAYLENRRPASITLVTLLDKPSRRKAPVRVDFCGFEVPDEFLVGYGLDYAEKYRSLPYIGVLKPEVYSGA